MGGPTRKLTLHESALSTVEYTEYVQLFAELVDDDKPNTTTQDGKPLPSGLAVGVREARGWLKGRYKTIDGSIIDKILRMFHPSLAPVDLLEEGQFYAVLRLIKHIQQGKEVDQDLIFIQPKQSSLNRRSPPLPPPPRRSVPTTPRQDRIDLSPTSSIPTNDVPQYATAPQTPTYIPNSNNPFAARSTSAPSSAKFPTTTSAVSSDEGSIPDTNLSLARRTSTPAAEAITSTSGKNPFTIRGKSKSTSEQSAPVVPLTGPPLPPRKPSFLPPPRHASQQAPPVHPQSTGTSSSIPPPKPPKPANISALPGHAISPLIKQSLLAAKHAANREERSLDKVRTWEVIKTSTGGDSASVSRASTDRSESPPPIGGTLPRRIKSTTSPAIRSDGEPDPDEWNSTLTLGRSKSLHQRTTPPLPPRRKRPESVQWETSSTASSVYPASTTSNPPSTISQSYQPPSSSTAASQHLQRRESLANSLNVGAEVLQKTFANLRPGLESARAKVEGKLIPSGYNRWREEKLVDDGSPGMDTTGRLRTRRTSYRSSDPDNDDDDDNERNRTLKARKSGAATVAADDPFSQGNSGGDELGWKPLRG